MAINNGDTRIAIVAETTKGFTPATPAFLLVDHLPGSKIAEAGDSNSSNTRKAGRTSSGQVVSGRRAEGTIQSELKRDAATELLLASAFCGSWQGDVLKGGKTDTSFTVEQTFYDGDAEHIRRATGVQASFSLECEYNGFATATFELLGLGCEHEVEPIADATYVNASTKPFIRGEKVTNVVIGGLNGIIPTKLSLSVMPEREAKGGFGSLSAAFIGTGKKQVEGSLTFLASDLAGMNLTGERINIGFQMESGVNGYQFSIPVSAIGVVSDNEDGTALEIEVPFIADRDEVQETDIVLTRLS